MCSDSSVIWPTIICKMILLSTARGSRRWSDKQINSCYHRARKLLLPTNYNMWPFKTTAKIAVVHSQSWHATCLNDFLARLRIDEKRDIRQSAVPAVCFMIAVTADLSRIHIRPIAIYDHESQFVWTISSRLSRMDVVRLYETLPRNCTIIFVIWLLLIQYAVTVTSGGSYNCGNWCRGDTDNF